MCVFFFFGKRYNIQPTSVFILFDMTHICVCRSSLPQHEEGMGLIEDNEINNNTLAGVWITTGKNLPAYPGHVTTITLSDN